MLQSDDKSELLLEMQGIDKSFPGVQALQDVSLALRPGEVLGIVGENGAGKSTLIKILGGAHRPDRGRIVLDGTGGAPFAAPAPRNRRASRSSTRSSTSIPDLTVRENMFLGRERTRGGFIRAAREQQEAGSCFRNSACRSIRQPAAAS